MEEKRQTKEVEVDEPLNWPAKIENGVLVITPISEEIKNATGGTDILLKMPSLRLIKEFKAAHNIQ
jgi:hypothetical protein